MNRALIFGCAQEGESLRDPTPPPRGFPVFPLCEQFQIDQDEIRARRDFLGLDSEDEKNLDQINSLIQEGIDSCLDTN